MVIIENTPNDRVRKRITEVRGDEDVLSLKKQQPERLKNTICINIEKLHRNEFITGIDESRILR